MTSPTDTEPAVSRREFYTLTEIVAKLPWKRDTVLRKLRQGLLCEYLMVGRQVLVRKQVWEDWVQQRESESKDGSIRRKGW